MTRAIDRMQQEVATRLPRNTRVRYINWRDSTGEIREGVIVMACVSWIKGAKGRRRHVPRAYVHWSDGRRTWVNAGKLEVIGCDNV